jgi:hypothetical protein
MQTSLVLQNLLSAPVLFFFLGVLAAVLNSDLEIPSPLPKLFSLCWRSVSAGAWSWPIAVWAVWCCSPSGRPC